MTRRPRTRHDHPLFHRDERSRFGLVGLILCTAAGLASGAEPHRFAHGALGQAGRVTLTPISTPDGKDLLFSSTRAFDDQAEGLIQVWVQEVAEVPALSR